MATESSAHELGQTVQEVGERVSVLVREEIELAKAEVTRKATALGKGAAVAAAAGVFALIGFLFFVHFLAWLLAEEVFDSAWLGYLVVAVFFFVIAGIAGLVGLRWIKKGAPPTPDMAIEEAKLIKETVTD